MRAAARIAYLSFDHVPAPKGAATHILAFARALSGAFSALDLVTVADVGIAQPATNEHDGVRHTVLPAIGRSLIDRVLCFRHYLRRWLDGRSFDAIQFRSIFEGIPLLQLRDRTRLIFVVNGLPSTELKYRYPAVVDDRDLMRKIIAQEQACLDAADLVITPSGVTREYLSAKRGIAAGKITVIPNGVDTDLFQPAPRRYSETMRLIYFGTLSAWQGVELAVRAVAQIGELIPAMLTIVGPGGGRERDALIALAAKLGVAGSVAVLPAAPQQELAAHMTQADAVLVPLTLNDRNIVQGCCPLKILEGMAAAVPVIASDLPVVRELGCDGRHFLLVKPGSVDQIAEAALRLWSDRAVAMHLANNGREHVVNNFTWNHSAAALTSAYEKLGIKRLSKR